MEVEFLDRQLFPNGAVGKFWQVADPHKEFPQVRVAVLWMAALEHARTGQRARMPTCVARTGQRAGMPTCVTNILFLPPLR